MRFPAVLSVYLLICGQDGLTINTAPEGSSGQADSALLVFPLIAIPARYEEPWNARPSQFIPTCTRPSPRGLPRATWGPVSSS